MKRTGKRDHRTTPRQDAPKHHPALTHARELELKIEKPIYGGQFLSRSDGKAHFIPFTAASESVRARVVDEKKNFAQCEVIEVLAPSPDRIAPKCEYFANCGGCAYQHLNYSAQVEAKKTILAETLTRAKLELPATIEAIHAEPFGYRNRIRLACTLSGKIGYRARKSSAIIPITNCPLAAPNLITAARAIEAALPHLPNIGVVEIELFTNSTDSQTLTWLTAQKPTAGCSQQLVAAVPLLDGIEILRAQSVTEDDFESTEPHAATELWGSNALDYSCHGFNYSVPLGAFFQVNRFLLDSLVERVLRATQIENATTAWDLYSGVGLFARPLTALFAQVVAVESAPRSFPALVRHLAGQNAQAVKATTENFLKHASKYPVPNLVVVDPPRAGLGLEVATRLNNLAPQRIISVSCDPATLARDLSVLTNYHIASVAMIDLFPQTHHLESLVVLDRK